MRVALVNLPWQVNNRFGVRAGSRWPFTSLPEKDGLSYYYPFPFSLAYATSLLKNNSHEVAIVDAIAESLSKAQLIKRLILTSPEIIFFETSTPSFIQDIKLIQ